MALRTCKAIVLRDGVLTIAESSLSRESIAIDSRPPSPSRANAIADQRNKSAQEILPHFLSCAEARDREGATNRHRSPSRTAR
jgi:hypothetical protein